MQVPSERQNKVARLIQKDLGELFVHYARANFSGTLLSVSVVRVSPDFSLAKCYISVFPSGKGQEVLDTLNANLKEIRFQLGKRIGKQMRIIPELAFFLDDSLDYIEKIDDLLTE